MENGKLLWKMENYSGKWKMNDHGRNDAGPDRIYEGKRKKTQRKLDH